MLTCTSATDLSAGQHITIGADANKTIEFIDATDANAVRVHLASSLTTAHMNEPLAFSAPLLAPEIQLPTKSSGTPSSLLWSQGDTEENSNAAANGIAAWVNVAAGAAWKLGWHSPRRQQWKDRSLSVVQREHSWIRKSCSVRSAHRQRTDRHRRHHAERSYDQGTLRRMREHKRSHGTCLLRGNSKLIQHDTALRGGRIADILHAKPRTASSATSRHGNRRHSEQPRGTLRSSGFATSKRQIHGVGSSLRERNARCNFWRKYGSESHRGKLRGKREQNSYRQYAHIQLRGRRHAPNSIHDRGARDVERLHGQLRLLISRL